jgi:hypothetical protein
MQDTQDKELSFVIPTHRLREVGDTIEAYDEHFWRNGHSVRLIVFDDSTPVNQQKYYPLLEQTSTHQPIWYVGPSEKEQFLAYLNSRLRDRRLETLVRNLFRPSYGGNRNCTLMYTLGGLMISSDDDMRPYSFVEYSPESLSADEVWWQAPPCRPERLYAEILRYSCRLRGCSGKANRPSPRQL